MTCAPNPESSDETASAPPAPVSGGAVTVKANVGRVFRAGGRRSCTGTLITPVHVLTAAHCFVGAEGPAGIVDVEGWGLDTPLDIKFGEAGIGQIGAVDATHTPGLRGPDHRVRILSSESTKEFSGVLAGISVAADDIAIIPLDRRIPVSDIAPAFIDLETPCYDGPLDADWEGLYMGYGCGPDFVEACTDVRDRTYATATMYGGTSPSPGIGGNFGYWRSRSDVLTFLGFGIPIWDDLVNLAFEGSNDHPEPGDSGGPLFEHADPDGRVCGVLSGGPFFSPIDCTFELDLLLWNCRFTASFAWADISAAGARYEIFRAIAIDPTASVSNTGWKGYCHDALPGLEDLTDVDSDNDLIPDACDPCPFEDEGTYDVATLLRAPDVDQDHAPDQRCDSCPTVGNPHYLSGSEFIIRGAPDFDSDGMGDVCDPAPGTPSGPIEVRSSNFETEMTLHYPERFDPPIIRWRDTNPNYAAEVEQRREAFKLTQEQLVASDTVSLPDPAPTPALVLSDGPVPPGAEAVPNALGECGTGYEHFSCQWSAKSLIQIEPLPSHVSAGQTGEVAVRWCACGRDDLESRRGRFECQRDGCVGLWERADLLPWRTPTTYARSVPFSFSGTADTTGAFTVLLDRTRTPSAFEQGQRSRLWDFTAGSIGTFLETPAWEEGLPLANQHRFVRGVLWSSTRAIPSRTSDAEYEPALHRSGAFTRGRAGYYRQPVRSPLDSIGLFDRLTGLLFTDCWVDGCPGYPGSVRGGPITYVGFPRGPVDRWGGGSTDPENLMAPCALRRSGCFPLGDWLQPSAGAVLAKAAQDPTLRVVRASEPLTLLGTSPDGEPILTAAFVRTDPLRLAMALVSGGIGGSPGGIDLEDDGEFDYVSDLDAAAGGGGGGPSPPSPEPKAKGPHRAPAGSGMAFSAIEKEFFVFGGGAPVPEELWVASMRDGSWQNIALTPGGRPASVLAATYRRADRALYEIDREGTTSRLRVWRRGRVAFETLATWPTNWNTFDRYWLVDGEAHDLVLAASRRGFSAIAWFRASADGTLAFQASHHFQGELTAPPLVTADGLLLSVATRDGASRGDFLAFSQITSRPPAWAPVFP